MLDEKIGTKSCNQRNTASIKTVVESSHQPHGISANFRRLRVSAGSVGSGVEGASFVELEI